MEPRIPPKFVPTLTEVVAFDEGAEGDEPEASMGASSLPPDEALAQTRTSRAGWAEPAEAPAPPAAEDFQPNMPPAQEEQAPAAINLAEDFEAQLTQRVLQRVQAALQAQLAGAIEDLVRQHTQAMLAPLSEKIEAVVRDTVGDAVQQELKDGR
ncbi:hypothetical protein GCM10027082_39080 [Comamonas humi]